MKKHKITPQYVIKHMIQDAIPGRDDLIGCLIAPVFIGMITTIILMIPYVVPYSIALAGGYSQANATDVSNFIVLTTAIGFIMLVLMIVLIDIAKEKYRHTKEYLNWSQAYYD